jgi:hypothetical protein
MQILRTGVDEPDRDYIAIQYILFSTLRLRDCTRSSIRIVPGAISILHCRSLNGRMET